MKRCLYDFTVILLFRLIRDYQVTILFSNAGRLLFIGLPAMALVFAIAAGDGGPVVRA